MMRTNPKIQSVRIHSDMNEALTVHSTWQRCVGANRDPGICLCCYMSFTAIDCYIIGRAGRIKHGMWLHDY